MTTYVDVLHAVDDAAFLDALDESIAGAVVGDGQSKGVLVFGEFNLLRPSFIQIITNLILSCTQTQEYNT